MVQAMALDEDEVPEIADETVPDEEGMARYCVAETKFFRSVFVLLSVLCFVPLLYLVSHLFKYL